MNDTEEVLADTAIGKETRVPAQDQRGGRAPADGDHLLLEVKETTETDSTNQIITGTDTTTEVTGTHHQTGIQLEANRVSESHLEKINDIEIGQDQKLQHQVTPREGATGHSKFIKL